MLTDTLLVCDLAISYTAWMIKTPPKKLGLASAVLAGLLSLNPDTVKAEGRELTVLELFTSQGCSSCPPADALLGVLKKRDDILALTLPVDYWDYIGWKDTFAKPQYTKRQRSYAQAQKKHQIYTPQLMINGKVDAVGSIRREVEGKIRSQKLRGATGVSLHAKKNGDQYHLSINAEKAGVGKTTLWLAAYQKEATVEIGRGENRGRKVTYYNVVHKLKPIGSWCGGQKTFEISRRDIAGKNINGAAVFLQKDKAGEIISARKLSF